MKQIATVFIFSLVATAAIGAYAQSFPQPGGSAFLPVANPPAIMEIPQNIAGTVGKVIGGEYLRNPQQGFNDAASFLHSFLSLQEGVAQAQNSLQSLVGGGRPLEMLSTGANQMRQIGKTVSLNPIDLVKALGGTFAGDITVDPATGLSNISVVFDKLLNIQRDFDAASAALAAFLAANTHTTTAAPSTTTATTAST